MTRRRAMTPQPAALQPCSRECTRGGSGEVVEFVSSRVYCNSAAAHRTVQGVTPGAYSYEARQMQRRAFRATETRGRGWGAL